ncbi:hypothetical protein GCM10025734_21250 [Kitasatospora paranensis]
MQGQQVGGPGQDRRGEQEKNEGGTESRAAADDSHDEKSTPPGAQRPYPQHPSSRWCFLHLLQAPAPPSPRAPEPRTSSPGPRESDPVSRGTSARLCAQPSQPGLTNPDS